MLGRRQLADGAVGWDVGELQFSLAWHGFASAGSTAGSGHAPTPRSDGSRPGHSVDGVVGPATLVALRQPAPARHRSRSRTRSRRDHRPLRAARKPLPHRHRLPGAGRDASGRTRGGHGHVRGLAGRRLGLRGHDRVGSGVRTMLAHLARVDVCSASASLRASRSAPSARPETPPGRTSTSRFGSAEPPSTRRRARLTLTRSRSRGPARRTPPPTGSRRRTPSRPSPGSSTGSRGSRSRTGWPQAASGAPQTRRRCRGRG